MDGAWSMHRRDEKYNISVVNAEGKRPFGRHRSSWEGNIKMDVTEIGQEVMYWIHLPQDRDQWRAVVNKVMNLPVS